MASFVSKIFNMHLGVCEVAGSTETETEQVAKKVMTADGISQLKAKSHLQAQPLAYQLNCLRI